MIGAKGKLAVLAFAVAILIAAVTFQSWQQPNGPYGAVEGRQRHKKWPATRAAHLKVNPRCEVCGCKDNLEVHHVLPYHRFPDLELEPGNLITLCRDHHFLFGHLLDWQSYNPDVRDDVAKWRRKIRERKR